MTTNKVEAAKAKYLAAQAAAKERRHAKERAALLRDAKRWITAIKRVKKQIDAQYAKIDDLNALRRELVQRVARLRLDADNVGKKHKSKVLLPKHFELEK